MQKELIKLWNEYVAEVIHTVRFYPTEFNKGEPSVHYNFLHFMDWLMMKEENEKNKDGIHKGTTS